MAIGLNPKVNPYQGNPYLYGYGPEHRWFTYGDIAPPVAPGEPAPAPQTPPLGQQAIPPSIFEGDGARDGGEGMFNDLEWEPAKPGPRMADVMAALAAAGQPAPSSWADEMATAIQAGGQNPAAWAGVEEDQMFNDNMLAENMVADNLAAPGSPPSGALTFGPPAESVVPSLPSGPPTGFAAPEYTPPSEQEQLQAGTGTTMGGGFNLGPEVMNTPVDVVGLGGIAGQAMSPEMVANMGDYIAGASGGKGVGALDALRGTGELGRTAVAGAQAAMSNAPPGERFGEKATEAFQTGQTGKGTVAALADLLGPPAQTTFTVGDLLGRVGLSPSAPVAPAEYGYAPPAPDYVPSDLPGYSPDTTVDFDTSPVVDQELIDNTPSFDQYGNPIGKAGDKISGLENLVDLTHLAEIIDPSAGALGLAGLNEDQLAGADLYGDYSEGLYGGSNVGSGGYVGGRGGENESYGSDALYGGYGTDALLGLTDTQIADLVSAYNDAAPAVGQPSPVEGFSTAIEAMQAANEGRTDRSQPGTEYTGSSGIVDSVLGRDKEGPTGGMGEGGSSTGSGGCYITTAAVDHMKLKDDGAHLKILRWYRDNVLAKTPEGRKQILEYKRVAPKIVQALNKRKDAPEVYKALFTSYIDPAAQAVVDGNYEDADKLYSSMVKQVADLS